MQINRDNYETVFLLYVDGELPAADRKAVEAFAAANPDLLKELEMLQASILSPDTILFEEKGELYRPVPIDALLQQKLLLRLDDELPLNELAALNESISTDKNIKAEFELLLRTKVDPGEKIIFEEKHLLYRKEKDRPVIPMFVRWAAAAVLIGLGLFFGIFILQQHPGGDSGLASTGKPGITTPAGNKKGANADPNIVDRGSTDGSQKNGIANLNSQKASGANTIGQEQPTKPFDTTVPKEGNETFIAQQEAQQQPNKNENNLPSPALKPSETLIAEVKQPKATETAIDNDIVPLETGYAAAASFNESDRSENKILYMDEDDVRRSKVGGLFRKVKRFAERTAKIKTGNSLRIAGFEIAAK